MRTVRRLLYRDILGAVAYVTLAFLALFFFIDLVTEVGRAARRGYTTWDALLLSLLATPGNLYELLPIALLIGMVFSLARLAQTSQFTVLRTAGLGPARTLGMLATLGLGCALLTFVVGDHLAPLADQRAQRLQAQLGIFAPGTTGAWLRDRSVEAAGAQVVSLHVARAGADGRFEGVRVFVFDERRRLVERLDAQHATVDADAVWTLVGVERSRWPPPAAAGLDGAPVQVERLDALRWPSGLHAELVSAALTPAATMSTLELWRYMRHLEAQRQDAQRYQVQFWRRALYPLSCVVMAMLALPFAYLHARAGGVSARVFGGVMLGAVFMLSNSLAAHLGVLRDWTPWVAAALPGTLFLTLSLAAFLWLVRYR
jgi:lipopolysaccharide export system permease protein